MSSHNDFLAGLNGGPRSDSSSFRWGEMLKNVNEANKIAGQIMAPPTVTVGSIVPNYLNQSGTNQGSATGTIRRGIFDAWDTRPGLSFWTFVIVALVSLMIVCPALDYVGALPETLLRIVLLGSVSLLLSAWTRALPFIIGGGVLLLFALSMLG